MFEQLEDAEIGPEVGQSILQQLKERQQALALSDIAFRVAQGLRPREELSAAIKAVEEVEQEVSLPIRRVSLNLEEIIDHVYKDRGLRWGLDCLNRSLGSLRSGDFGFVFARPETGKTTFLASTIASMLRGLPDGRHPIVWINNEEQGEKVAFRLIQSYFGITTDVLVARARFYRERFDAEVGEKLILLDDGIIERRDVESVVRSLQPRLVIYDQVDKIRGFTNDRKDLQLGDIYQWVRELAKNSHTAIGVCQADGTAEGVRYLTMEHVANAKTAKQAEADFILGIGCQHGDGQEYMRYLNISKNKLMGDEDTLPEFRHGRFEVLIEPQIARYRDIITFD